jgi:hypothetical protein
MALVSPGVEVTVIDESQYLPAPTNTIPLIVLATAQNKADPTGTAVAAGTTAANAGKLYQVTSQRDLVTLYGNPFFYSTSNGTPIQGYELNEYGLLAAYSALGITNRVFTMRADIDLASLVGQTGRPTGNPDNGAYWLDTTTSTWGIYEFNSTTGQFVLQSPIVITSTDQVSGHVPLSSVGQIGDYAVVAIPTYDYPSAPTAGMYFYKTASNQWVRVGSADWASSWPTVQASQANPELTPGDILTLDISGQYTLEIEVQNAPNNVVSVMAADINAFDYPFISADVVGGKLVIYSAQLNQQGSVATVSPYIIASGTGTVLADLGIAGTTYYQTAFFWGAASRQPLWQAGQSVPRPTGSVWIKVGSAGNGLDSAISEWSSTTSSWIPKTVGYSRSDWQAILAVDAAGGKNIPAGAIYAQYFFNSGGTTYNGVNPNSYIEAPIYYWERIAEGPTVITGSVLNPVFGNTIVNAGYFQVGSTYQITTVGTTNFTLIGSANNTVGTIFTATGVGTGTGTATLRSPYTLSVNVTIPGTSVLSSTYTVTINNNSNANAFVTAWSAAGIPYTTCTVTDAGALQLTHTEGGCIILEDFNSAGLSNGLIGDAGFVIGSTTGVKEGPFAVTSYQPTQTSTTGVGTGLQIDVQNYYQTYLINPTSFGNDGTGHAVGDEITFSGAQLGGTSPANDLICVVNAVSSGNVTELVYKSGSGAVAYSTCLSNWVEFEMTANEGAPTQAPVNNTNWFFSVVDEVDIMVNTSSGWLGYKNTNYDSNGFPQPGGVNATDPNGPIVSASEPTTQSDGTVLVYGDIWIDTSDLENYPIINRWQSVENVDRWVRIDNTDQTGSTGVLFADARWATNGTTNPANDPIPSIKSLLTSNYLDLDAPSNASYPVGMLLFNTRRSGYNVKQYRVNYFNNDTFPDQTLPLEKDAWVTASGLQSNGSPYMGRKAQRNMVVQALRSAVDTNTAIRDEDNTFNIIACPNYPELQPNMIVLNADRGETGFIIGDTPMRLPDDATAIQAWATNAAGATSTGEEGLVSRSTYMGLFYPSGIAPDLSGNLVAVPSSHMMIRTILRNDNVAYPWFAPAGTRRGIIDNATNIGYVDSVTGEFQVIKTRIGIRDVLYTNQINPMVFFTGNGLLNYGNKSSFASNSALDRINVARLVAYIRRQLTVAARPFVFEPNDSITRQQIAGVVETLMVDLVAKRGLYDYLVVCDESNNTPARIDRNELWVDVAIEPVKAIEFIYIPVRVLNTGELSA